MEAVAISLGKRAQVVIPKKARIAIGLSEGEKGTLVYQKGFGVILGDSHKYGSLLRGLGKEIWKKVGGGDVHLHRERTSWQ